VLVQDLGLVGGPAVKARAAVCISDSIGEVRERRQPIQSDRAVRLRAVRGIGAPSLSCVTLRCWRGRWAPNWLPISSVMPNSLDGFMTALLARQRSSFHVRNCRLQVDARSLLHLLASVCTAVARLTIASVRRGCDCLLTRPSCKSCNQLW
jgi:hypothetical protein